MQARVPPITYITLAIACFSLATAMYQGYLQARNMEEVQRDITRREVIRGCKDGIEAYFEAKLRIGLLADAVRRQGDVDRHHEAAAIAASRFAAIGTFLANGQNDAARARYTELSREIERLVAAAGAGSIEDLGGAYAAADGLFKGMNQDCVGSARLDFI